MYLKHPLMRDVALDILKRFYIKEKDMWSLKIQWVHARHGYILCQPYRIKITREKLQEFELFNMGDM